MADDVTKVQEPSGITPPKENKKVTNVQYWYMRAGWMYAIQHGKTDLYKLGITRSKPDSRLGAMQTGNPEELRLVGVWPVMDAETTEALVHQLCSSCRVRGEWFKLTAWHKDAIEKLLGLEANYYERKVCVLHELGLWDSSRTPRTPIDASYDVYSLDSSGNGVLIEPIGHTQRGVEAAGGIWPEDAEMHL